MSKASFHVISHTHWDREWYLTFEQFRFRLVDLINGLLELLDRDPEFKVFHLDGQTIVLEDYYAIHPENKDRLERYIQEGRILVGPWYLQNDEYLTSGEATVRNLQVGIAMSRAIAREMKVGYLPDQFGNISQMPQILRGFGIGNAVFGRGYDNFKTYKEQEFLWEGADGSRVTAVFLPNWYNNAQRFPEEPRKARKTLEMIRAKIDERKQTNNYLLMNGVDHLEAQENLSGILAELRASLPEGEEILHTTLEEHIRRVEQELINPAVQVGEMRAGDDYHILAGTLSARVYLKQANARAQDLLEKWIEPLSVWVSQANLGDYPQAYLTYLWKELMKNHPHDSICGCSQDEVHEHMMDRFASVTEAGEELFKRQVALLAKQIDVSGLGEDDQLITVLNPAPEPMSGLVEAVIDFLEQDGVAAFRLEDATGKEVHYKLLHREKTRKQRLSPINLPTELPVDRFKIQISALDVSAQGYVSYRVVPHEEPSAATDSYDVSTQPTVMENDRLRVAIEKNGSLTITDIRSGRTYRNHLTLIDDADAGDLYVFKYLEGSGTLTSEGLIATIRPMDQAEGYQACEIEWNWQLPEGLGKDGKTRSSETVPYQVKATVGLQDGSARVDVRLELDNTAKDHRLRVRFPHGNDAKATMAGSPFDVVVRPLDEGADYVRNANSQPNYKWVAAGTDFGFAIYNRGLHEYEWMPKADALDLTLVRSVGTIFGRPNPLPHENDHNPGGQCPGRHVFEFAIRPFGAEDHPAKLAREAEAYHHGLRCLTTPVCEDKWASGRPWVQDSEIGDLFSRLNPNAGKKRLARNGSFLEIEGEGAVVTAVKRQHGGGLTAVRFYNALDRPDEVTVRVPHVKRAWKADLLEHAHEELNSANGEIKVQVRGKEIVTVLIETNEKGGFME